MRDIKFRAWLKEKGEMREVLGYYQQTFWLRHLEEFNIMAHIDEVEVMQYTGFKDSCCSEIFEGDILRDSYGVRFRVVFENGRFTTYKMDKTYNFEYELDTLIKSKDEIRVVSNIYEGENV